MFDFVLGFKPNVRPMYPDELGGVLDYQTRLERAGLSDAVESAAGPAVSCALVLTADRFPYRFENVEVK